MKKEVLDELINLKKNLVVEGDVASGKTTNVLFPIVETAIEKKENLFVIDSKEEYINKYYGKLKENGYNVIILNLRDLDKSEGWNPLEYPYNLYKSGKKDEAQELVIKVGKNIFDYEADQDPFWSLTAADFFAGITLALFEDAKKEEINLNSVNNVFNGNDKKFGISDYVTEYFKTKDLTSMSYILASTTVMSPKETKGSIIAVARQKLKLFVAREKLSCLMNKTTFDLKESLNKPTAIIFIARDENKYLNSLVGMFIEQLYSILIDLKLDNKFNLVLDNFDVMSKCNDLVDILNSCTSRNIKTYIATRSINELTKIYGEYMTKLCDLLTIRNEDINLVINGEAKTVEKQFETVNIETTSIDYPTLTINQISMFDLEKYVNENRIQEFKTTTNMDDLLKKIDDKIQELEKEEK